MSNPKDREGLIKLAALMEEYDISFDAYVEYDRCGSAEGTQVDIACGSELIEFARSGVTADVLQGELDKLGMVDEQA